MPRGHKDKDKVDKKKGTNSYELKGGFVLAGLEGLIAHEAGASAYCEHIVPMSTSSNSVSPTSKAGNNIVNPLIMSNELVVEVL